MDATEGDERKRGTGEAAGYIVFLAEEKLIRTTLKLAPEIWSELSMQHFQPYPLSTTCATVYTQR